MNCPPLVYAVLGVLCLLLVDSVGKCADGDSFSRDQGRWRWLDASVELPPAPALNSSASPSPCSFPRPFDELLLNGLEAFDLTPRPVASYDDAPFPAFAAPVPIVSDESCAPLETIYRGGAVSTLAIAPYGRRFFAYGLGGWGDQSAQNAAADKPGFTVDSWGGGFGTDWNLFNHGIVGYGLHGGSTNVKPRSGGVYKTSLSTFAGYLHFSVFDALWRIDASLGWARNWQRQRLLSDRSYNIFTTSQWLFDVQFGARFDQGYTRIEPIVNMRVLNLNEPKKAEKYLTAKGFASDFSDASYRLKIGSRFSWEHEALLATLKPYLLATWAHEFGSRDVYTIGDSTPFPVAFRHGAHRMARDRLDLGGGLEAAMRQTLDLYFQYDVEFADDYVAYLFFAGLNKKF